MTSARKRQATLVELLSSLFSVDELRRFLVGLSGPEVTAELPGGAVSRSHLVHETVDLLVRRGLVEAEFFDLLEQERPRRREEVRAVRRLWLGEPASTPPPVALRSAPLDDARPRRITDIFWTTARPGVLPVEPDQLGELCDCLSALGEGLVVDGPSGIGKSTAVRLAVEKTLGGPLDDLQRDGRVRWIRGSDEEEKADLDRRLAAGARALRGLLVIDDYHLLDRPLQRRIADLIKSVADGGVDAKVVVVGINPVGTSLTRDFPDLVGRFAAVPMKRQSDQKVEELIRLGERLANIRFLRREQIVNAARGSLITAQHICLEAARSEGLRETAPELRTLAVDIEGPITDRVVARLKDKFYESLCGFASYGQQAPPAGATFATLWQMSRASDATVSLSQVRRSHPTLAAEIDWLLASNLATLFEREPLLRRLFFYNRDGGVLSAEDPQLEFYLRHLSWPALARDSGQIRVDWDASRELTFAPTQLIAPVRRGLDDTPRDLPRVRVLHLSDLHVGDRERALIGYDQLYEDLRFEQQIERLDALVISGDIANQASPEEYEHASVVLRALKEDFKLGPGQIVLVPGNHDLSWVQSKMSYRAYRRADYKGELIEGQFLDRGEYIEVPDPEEHRARFRAFSELYFALRAEAYPLDYESQATLHHLPDQRLLFLGLNSSWRIDHHHRDRADIQGVALGRALRRVAQETAFQGCLKIAVWHHPIRSGDDDRLRDTGFVERLTQAGFRFGLHGHIHKPQQELFRYDLASEGRRLDILGAGTAGAPTREWQPGFPLQYQLLEIEGAKLTVRSRRREDPNGAWKPDARFTVGPGEDPRSWYEIAI